MSELNRWYVMGSPGAEQFWCYVADAGKARAVSGPYERECHELTSRQALRRAVAMDARAVYRATPQWLRALLAAEGVQVSSGAWEIVGPGTAVTS